MIEAGSYCLLFAKIQKSFINHATQTEYPSMLFPDLMQQKKAEERWGAGVVEQISLDLKRKFPNADGVSARNLWNMKQWYMFYNGKC